MSFEEGDKLDRIEELKSKLFSKSYQTKIEHTDAFPHFQKRNVLDSWIKKEKKDDEPGFEEKFFMKTTLFKKFFIFSIVFFVLAIAYASYMFFIRGNTVSNDNIDISIQSNAFTAGGEEYPLLLTITNRNISSLELVDLLVEYPKGSENVLSQDNEHIRISLGTIASGEVKNENVKFVLYGEQGSMRQVKISLEYRVEGSNAIFVKEKFFDISINSTPINILVDAPQEVVSNQEFTLDVKNTLNATRSVSGMLLRVDYPIGFQFIKATPTPSSGDNVWNLGDLAPGAERNISITGKMIDVFDGEEKVFRVWSGSQSATDKSLIGVVFNSSEHNILIKKSSIEARLLVNGVYQKEYTVDTKSSIQGQIQWKNNLETKINDLEIRAKISGNAFNRKAVSAGQGFYNSSEDSIIWDKNSDSNFREVNPGDSGAVSFSLSPASLFSAQAGILDSPSINIIIFITGKQVQNGSATQELSNSESKVVKIISDLGFSNKALYYSGPFKNTGPIPPKVEQKTTYTIVWSLSNTSNNISKGRIRSALPSWIRFTGFISPTNEDLTYDSLTREVIWNIGTIPKGTGISGSAKEVSFQVELTPSLSQVGTAPVIVNDAVLTGHDDFANVDVQVNKSALNTKLLKDLAFPAGGEKVVE